MSTAKKLDLDGRGRITLPKEMREGVETFSAVSEADGSIRLIPQKHVSIEDAKLLESLKKSAKEYKKGSLHKAPPDWMD